MPHNIWGVSERNLAAIAIARKVSIDEKVEKGGSSISIGLRGLPCMTSEQKGWGSRNTPSLRTSCRDFADKEGEWLYINRKMVWLSYMEAPLDISS